MLVEEAEDEGRAVEEKATVSAMVLDEVANKVDRTGGGAPPEAAVVASPRPWPKSVGGEVGDAMEGKEEPKNVEEAEAESEGSGGTIGLPSRGRAARTREDGGWEWVGSLAPPTSVWWRGGGPTAVLSRLGSRLPSSSPSAAGGGGSGVLVRGREAWASVPERLGKSV